MSGVRPLQDAQSLMDCECNVGEAEVVTLSAVVDNKLNYVANLHDKDPQTRINALRYLGDLDADGICIASEINKLRNDWSPLVRLEAAAALGRLSQYLLVHSARAA